MQMGLSMLMARLLSHSHPCWGFNHQRGYMRIQRSS
jgi:hypothetical protein